ncbi:MAG: CU044_2847 family protein [Janthinobacterium lividum]
MPDIIKVKFASGNTVQFGNPQGGGLSPVGMRDAVAEKAAETFDRALGALGDVVARLEAAIGGLPRRPDGVEVEFSASLKGDCDLWVVSGEAEAEFKVTLKWDRKES